MKKISHIKKDKQTIQTKNLTIKDGLNNNKVVNKGGRPSINLEQFEDEIYDLLKVGATISQVLNYIGIDQETYYRKLRKNKRLKDKFARAKEFTSVTAKQNISEKIQQGDIDTSKWYLEKTEYKNRDTTAFQSDGDSIKFIITRE